MQKLTGGNNSVVSQFDVAGDIALRCPRPRPSGRVLSGAAPWRGGGRRAVPTKLRQCQQFLAFASARV
jgi:hypothetical protein